MKNKFLKVVCIMVSSFLVLTACGNQQNSDEGAFSEVELSSEKPSGTDTSISETPITPDSSEVPITSDSAVQTETDRPKSDSSDGDIIVANIWGESSFFSKRVVNFDKENSTYGIQYLTAYEGAEPDRILMEVANGKGPDILYMYQQDVESLQANGALGEIGQLISDENKDALLPGAIQMGTYDDKLFAIPLSVNVRSLLTSREYWQEDSWTIEDILSVAKGNPEIEGLFVDISGSDDYFYNMYFMMGMDIRNSPFLKDGSSSFDCQEFRELLTTVKEMTQKAVNNSTPLDRLLPLTEGNYLGVECFIPNMKKYCDIYDKMGENANLVGYPEDMGNGCHYLVANGMLVVNQNAMAKEGVRELVNELLSLESQKYIGATAVSVRMDIPESQLVYDKSSKTYIWTSPDNNGFMLPAKADGTSYADEYVKFLKSAAPASFESDELFDIVMEEANGYFNSNKNVDEVIEIIQNRMQNYMDEQK